MKRVALTTIDNPFDPFTEFSDWLDEDNRLGYSTPSLVGRFSVLYGLDGDENDIERYEEILDEIIRYDILNVYVKKYSDDSEGFDIKTVRY